MFCLLKDTWKLKMTLNFNRPFSVLSDELRGFFVDSKPKLTLASKGTDSAEEWVDNPVVKVITVTW